MFGPLEALGRTPVRAWTTTLIAGALMVGVFVLAVEDAPELTWLMFIFGFVLGYLTHRRRSHRPWLQIGLSSVLPGVIAALLVAVSQLPAATIASVGVLPAVVLGHFASRGAEHLFGPRRKVQRAAWADVSLVGSRHDPDGVKFDVRPLSETVSRSEARAFRPHVGSASLAIRATVLKWLFIVAAPILLIALIAGFYDEATKGGDNVNAQLVGLSAFTMLLIMAYTVIGWVGFRGTRHATSLADHVRFAKFAGLNGFAYTPGPVADHFGRAVSRVMSATRGRPWMIANATRTEPLPAESSAAGTMFSGACEIQVGVSLPNLLLVSRKRRLPSFSAHQAPVQSQRLSLEGDFDRHFTLYCPAGYERDALYILTPDVMANLIDGARSFDVEFIDDRLVLRTRRDMVSLDPAQWQRIAVAVNALSGRLQQWERWRDDRLEREVLGDNARENPRLITEKPTGTALAGRRLRLGLSVGGVLTLAFFGIYGALVYLANAL